MASLTSTKSMLLLSRLQQLSLSVSSQFIKLPLSQGFVPAVCGNLYRKKRKKTSFFQVLEEEEINFIKSEKRS